MKYTKIETIPEKGVILFGGEIITVPEKFIAMLETLDFQGNEEACEKKLTNLPEGERHLRVKILFPDEFLAGKRTFYKAYKNRNLQGDVFRWLLLSQREPFDLQDVPYEIVRYDTFISHIFRWVRGCDNELKKWLP